MIARVSLAGPLGPTRGLLWILPVLWGVLVIRDLEMATLVAVVGEPLAFLGVRWSNSPDDIPMEPLGHTFLPIVIVLAVVITIIDLLVARRLPNSRGPAFTVFGLITAPYLLAVAAAGWANPLWVIDFGNGDAGIAKIAPGPPWFQPTRATLLASIVIVRLGAVFTAGRRSVDEGLAEADGETEAPGRPWSAVVAAAALITLAAMAVVITIVNLVAVQVQLAQAAALNPDPYSLGRFQLECLRRLIILTASLIITAVGSAAMARLFRRGARSTLAAMVPGFVAVAWIVVLYVCLVINPGGWRSPMRVSGERLEVGWYATVLTPIMIIAVAALVTYWVTLPWPGTVRWLINGPARPRHSRPRPR